MERHAELHNAPFTGARRAPFRAVAGLAGFLILTSLNPFMGQDRLDKKPDPERNKKPAVVKVEENHSAKITASKLGQPEKPKTAVRIPVEGVFAEKQGFWGKVGDFFAPKAYGADNIIEAQDVLDAINLTEDLKRKGIVKEVKLNTRLEGGAYKVTAGEWIIETERDPEAPRRSDSFVYNKKAAQDNERAPFITRSLWGEALRYAVSDMALVKGYVIQRPDDPKQSVLVLACKDHLDIYVLNDKKEIEWIPIILKDVGIEKKPEIAIIDQKYEGKHGKSIVLFVMDEIAYKKVITNSAEKGETANLAVTLIAPSPGEKFDSTKGSRASPGTVYIANLSR